MRSIGHPLIWAVLGCISLLSFPDKVNEIPSLTFLPRKNKSKYKTMRSLLSFLQRQNEFVRAQVMLVLLYDCNGWTLCNAMALTDTTSNTILCNGSVLLLWLRDNRMRFQVVCLSIPLCAHVVFERSIDRKWYNSSRTSSNSQDDSSEQSSRCWQLKDKKNSPSTINNHLLERIGVTVISPLFS